MHLAVICGHVKVVKMLIDSGANIEATGWNELTPLHYAAKEGHNEVVKMLLQHGANTEATCLVL